MKYILTLVLLYIATTTHGQREMHVPLPLPDGTKIILHFYQPEDVCCYAVPNLADTLHIGDQIKIGNGSLPKGEFEYVTGIGLEPVNPNIVGTAMIVNSITRGENMDHSYTFYMYVIPPDSTYGHRIYLPGALRKKEIEILHKPL